MTSPNKGTESLPEEGPVVCRQFLSTSFRNCLSNFSGVTIAVDGDNPARNFLRTNEKGGDMVSPELVLKLTSSGGNAALGPFVGNTMSMLELMVAAGGEKARTNARVTLIGLKSKWEEVPLPRHWRSAKDVPAKYHKVPFVPLNGRSENVATSWHEARENPPVAVEMPDVEDESDNEPEVKPDRKSDRLSKEPDNPKDGALSPLPERMQDQSDRSGDNSSSSSSNSNHNAEMDEQGPRPEDERKIEVGESVDAIELAYLSALSLSELKSHLQKCIRFGALESGVFTRRSTSLMLSNVVRSMSNHSGELHPALNIYTTGIESLSKRLAVCCIEDAMPFALETQQCKAVCEYLLAVSSAVRRNRLLKAAPALVEFMCEVAVAAWASPHAADFSALPATGDKKKSAAARNTQSQISVNDRPSTPHVRRSKKRKKGGAANDSSAEEEVKEEGDTPTRRRDNACAKRQRTSLSFRRAEVGAEEDGSSSDSFSSSACVDTDVVMEDGEKSNDGCTVLRGQGEATWASCYSLLSDLGSFASDIQLFGNSMQFEHTMVPVLARGGAPPAYMHPAHSYDSHTAPVCAFLSPLASSMLGAMPNPFSPFMAHLFTTVSGVNPRRHQIPADWPSDGAAFVNPCANIVPPKCQHLAKAMRDLTRAGPYIQWFALQRARPVFCKTRNGCYSAEWVARPPTAKTYQRKLGDAWLSGKIGHVEVRVDGKALLVFPTTNGEFNVVHKPSRNQTSSTVSPHLFRAGRRAFSKKLTTGGGLSISSPEFACFHRKKVTEGPKPERQLLLDGVPWSEARLSAEFTVPEITPGSKQFSFANLISRNLREGILAGAEQAVAGIVGRLSVVGLRRLLAFVGGYSGAVCFPVISRAGGGVVEPVLACDGEVYRCLLELAWWYPGAIAPCGPCRFVTTTPPLLWKLGDDLRAFVADEKRKKEAAERDADLGQEIERVAGAELESEVDETIGTGKKSGFPWREDQRKRTPLPHQAIFNDKAGPEAFLISPTGSGKSYMAVQWLRKLDNHRKMPNVTFVAVPPSALATVWGEFRQFLPQRSMRWLITNKMKEQTKDAQAAKLCENNWSAGKQIQRLVELPNFMTKEAATTPTVFFILHDHLRKAIDVISEHCPDYAVVIDEVHKTISPSSQRTAASHRLTSGAKAWLAMSGTPVLNTDMYPLARWLQPLVGFPVNRNNIFVAMALMHSLKVETGVKVKDIEVNVPELHPWELEEHGQQPGGSGKKKEDRRLAEYLAFAPPAFGGSNRCFSGHTDLRRLLKLNQAWLDKHMVAQVQKNLRKGRGVLVVARDKAHQAVLETLIRRHKRTPKDLDLLVLDKGGVNREDKSARPTVVITRAQLAEGYNATVASAMVTCVHLSNQATRDQLRGRIDRLSQTSEKVYYITVTGGVLARVSEKYKHAASLAALVRELAKEI